MQTLNTGRTNEIQVVRSFSKGLNDIFILERPDGSFCYQNGKPVMNREHLEWLPKEHVQRALDWFDEEEELRIEAEEKRAEEEAKAKAELEASNAEIQPDTGTASKKPKGNPAWYKKKEERLRKEAEAQQGV